MTDQINARVTLSPLVFAILKTKQPIRSAFVNIIDLDEVTVIIEQGKYAPGSDVISAALDWRLFTLAPAPLPEAGELTAKVISAMTTFGVTAVPITAFDREHFLIKKSDLAAAITRFETLGFPVAKP